MPSDWVKHVWQAADQPLVRQAVRDLYEQVQQEIDQRRPRCEMSGRCCKFEEFGHRMYITTLELAAFVHDLAERNSAQRRREMLTAWNGRGCPFQVGKLCGVHTFRPFGCRIFFCDPSATVWQQDQYELFHAKLKDLHGKFEIPYAYIEWRAALGELLCQPVGTDQPNHADDVGQTI